MKRSGSDYDGNFDCERAYRILVEEVRFPPEDIIFDPNILTGATGRRRHTNYGGIHQRHSFDQAKPCPREGKRGVSNISFSFRGTTKVSEAMHSAFLYHAISG